MLLTVFWALFLKHHFCTNEKQSFFNVDYPKGEDNVHLVSSEDLSSTNEGDVHILSSAQVLADDKECQHFHSKQKLRHHSFQKSNIHINLLCNNDYNALEKVIECDFQGDK